MKAFIITLAIAMMFFLLVGTVSWLATCGIIYLITLCFGLEFSWLVATGIWAALWLVGGLFHVNVNVRE